jgi:hypothetical protein
MTDHDGHYSFIDGSGLTVTEVFSSTRKPRLAGDGCGCERDVRWEFGKEEHVVKLCEKHGREPGIVRYMLP